MERYKPLRSVIEIIQSLKAEELVPQPVPRKKKRKVDVRTIRRKWREHWHTRTDPGHLQRSGLRDHFHKLRGEIMYRARNKKPDSTANFEWHITLDEWVNMWLSCPAVETGFNVKCPAWKARGRHPERDVQLRRADPKKGYEINNLEIWRGKEKLWPEEESHPIQK